MRESLGEGLAWGTCTGCVSRGSDAIIESAMLQKDKYKGNGSSSPHPYLSPHPHPCCFHPLVSFLLPFSFTSVSVCGGATAWVVGGCSKEEFSKQEIHGGGH